MLTGHARTVRSVALRYATFARATLIVKVCLALTATQKIGSSMQDNAVSSRGTCNLNRSFCICLFSGLLEITLEILCTDSSGGKDQDVVPLLTFIGEPALYAPVGRNGGPRWRVRSGIFPMVMMFPIDETQSGSGRTVFADRRWCQCAIGRSFAHTALGIECL